MSHGKRKRRGSSSNSVPEAPELNIMPFIDIFSMLNTFLLVSAAFLGLGIVEVQIPFLSNSPDLKEQPQRSYSLRIDINENEIITTGQWTAEPIEKSETKYQTTDADIARFHTDLIAIRNKVPENDKVTVYIEDKVLYEQTVKVLDAIKTLNPKDPPLTIPATAGEDPAKAKIKQSYLFDKVVIGSVIL